MQKMNIDIRKEIETLAIWYIPVCIMSVIVSGLYTGYFKEALSIGSTASWSTIHFLLTVPAIIKFADNIVVGVWLYFLVEKEGGRTGLWFVFGLAAHLFAVLIYVVLRVYEQQAFNNPLKRGLVDASRPETP
ncbi:hypothetical protein [Methylobacter sp. YRD-M1]|uniref:hypothetical protein n=1 Tax=Methylobacter sp. YRD-M1 TaxID=2911520 RepID=UPI00227BDDF7|nr:hypothetical protein [Methylobacter sp. YRD-M1]WAK04069.1 hypothetical protein LZ558_09860 [Methylobacter sp. YRD-M1]